MPADRPRRRLHLDLTLDADDLQEVVAALQGVATDLYLSGQEQTEHTAGGYHSSHHLVLTLTDETMDGDTYRRLFTEWHEADKARESADSGSSEQVAEQ